MVEHDFVLVDVGTVGSRKPRPPPELAWRRSNFLGVLPVVFSLRNASLGDGRDRSWDSSYEQIRFMNDSDVTNDWLPTRDSVRERRPWGRIGTKDWLPTRDSVRERRP